jgi:hypothetical protein
MTEISLGKGITFPQVDGSFSFYVNGSGDHLLLSVALSLKEF